MNWNGLEIPSNPYYQDLHNTIYWMDFRKNDLPDESVQMVCTSPPYWGLRKYSGEQELIWGDNHCEHRWDIETISAETWNKDGHVPAFGRGEQPTRANRPSLWQKVEHKRGFCSLCGAWKGAYGLEPTPEMYIEHTIEILREIRRVLRKDGVVFWNIGDSYSPSSTHHGKEKAGIHAHGEECARAIRGAGKIQFSDSLKPKDLCLIPFRVAIAAQEDGWWVRSVIIWSKPNPMPESVTDRPTESHEYILMLTKSARYYWDADAVREPDHPDGRKQTVRRQTDRYNGELLSSFQDQEHERWTGSRNIRTVWEFPTQPYPEAHFAVFPEKLPEICIKAASKENDLILDPFMGAGTTLWVAKKLNRNAVGFDISEEYCQLAIERIRQQVMELSL